MSERYEVLVLGGGTSELALARRAERHARVALVERELLGGTCLNHGCRPRR